MDISFIVLTNLFASSLVEAAAVDPAADVVCADVDSAVAIGAVGANVAARVEGTTVVTVGMTVAACRSIINASLFELDQAIQLFLHLL